MRAAVLVLIAALCAARPARAGGPERRADAGQPERAGAPTTGAPSTGAATTAAATTAAPTSAAPTSGAPASVTLHGSLIDALGAADPREVERAVTVLLAQPPRASDPDVLFAAARACEDRLDDPVRALAIYRRVVDDHPSARVSTAAARRAAMLRELIGPHGEAAALATQLAQLIAHADELSPATVLQRGELLAAARWPGAANATLWLADWLRRSGRLVEAQARYARVLRRWPELPQARSALRGGAGCALEARNWELAEALASQLPAAEPADQLVREDLLDAAARGRRRDRLYVAAWLAILGALAGLTGSLVETVVRSSPGTRRSVLRPPSEVIFLAPVVAVLIGVALTTHLAIAPAVTGISFGGLAIAWLSGAALERLRSTGRAWRLRSVAHVLLCLAGVAGLAYVALTHDGLIDQLIDAVRASRDS